MCKTDEDQNQTQNPSKRAMADEPDELTFDLTLTIGGKQYQARHGKADLTYEVKCHVSDIELLEEAILTPQYVPYEVDRAGIVVNAGRRRLQNRAIRAWHLGDDHRVVIVTCHPK